MPLLRRQANIEIARQTAGNILAPTLFYVMSLLAATIPSRTAIILSWRCVLDEKKLNEMWIK